MNILSNERLEEIAELARKATYKPCAMHMTNLIAACDSEVVEALARELLSLRKEREAAVPVFEVEISGEHWINAGPAKGVDFWLLPDGIITLYAAPPAQPVAVLDEMLAAMEEVLRISDRDHEAWHRVRDGIASCRAAMLKEAK